MERSGIEGLLTYSAALWDASRGESAVVDTKRVGVDHGGFDILAEGVVVVAEEFAVLVEQFFALRRTLRTGAL